MMAPRRLVPVQMIEMVPTPNLDGADEGQTRGSGESVSVGKDVPVKTKASEYWPDAVDDAAGGVNHAELHIVDSELVAQGVLERAESGVGP